VRTRHRLRGRGTAGSSVLHGDDPAPNPKGFAFAFFFEESQELGPRTQETDEAGEGSLVQNSKTKSILPSSNLVLRGMHDDGLGNGSYLYCMYLLRIF